LDLVSIPVGVDSQNGIAESFRAEARSERLSQRPANTGHQHYFASQQHGCADLPRHSGAGSLPEALTLVGTPDSRVTVVQLESVDCVTANKAVEPLTPGGPCMPSDLQPLSTGNIDQNQPGMYCA
jgi:hypothetical protein